MQNNSVNGVLLAIIIVLLGVSIWSLSENFRNNEQNSSTAIPTGQTQTKDNADGPDYQPNRDTPSQYNYNWQAVSKTELAAVVSAYPDLWFDKEMGLSLSQAIDLTGDGVPEGIVRGDGGNNDVSFILFANNGSLSVAKQKNKNGTIEPVALYEIGRVQANASFQLLPNEHGFYTSSLVPDESSESVNFKCTDVSVNAYVWNPSTTLFEWNAALTATEHTKVCK
jgi:hypothetical protein